MYSKETYIHHTHIQEPYIQSKVMTFKRSVAGYPLFTYSLLNVATYTDKYRPQKSRIYSQKSPIYLQKCPVYSQLETTSKRSVAGYPLLTYSSLNVATCTHKHRRTQTHTRRHRQTQTHRHADTQTQRHRDTQTHRHTDTLTHRHTDTQTHRYTDTQTHRHINT